MHTNTPKINGNPEIPNPLPKFSRATPFIYALTQPPFKVIRFISQISRSPSSYCLHSPIIKSYPLKPEAQGSDASGQGPLSSSAETDIGCCYHGVVSGCPGQRRSLLVKQPEQQRKLCYYLFAGN